jgi:hypothetical protein
MSKKKNIKNIRKKMKIKIIRTLKVKINNRPKNLLIIPPSQLKIIKIIQKNRTKIKVRDNGLKKLIENI